MVCTKRLSISLAEEYILGLTLGSFDSNLFPASLVNRYISSVMDVAGPSRKIPAATSTLEPLSCPHCFLSYSDFCHIYTDNFKWLVSYAQTHGLLLSEKVCVALICRKKDFVVTNLCLAAISDGKGVISFQAFSRGPGLSTLIWI